MRIVGAPALLVCLVATGVTSSCSSGSGKTYTGRIVLTHIATVAEIRIGLPMNCGHGGYRLKVSSGSDSLAVVDTSDTEQVAGNAGYVKCAVTFSVKLPKRDAYELALENTKAHWAVDSSEIADGSFGELTDIV